MVRIAALVLSLALAGCSKSDAPPPPPAATPPAAARASVPAAGRSKDPELARKLIGSGATVVDVRTPEEFAEGHLPTATNIPVGELPKRLAEIDALVGHDKAKPIVVYCGSGHRAGVAKKQLEGAGYTQVVNGGGLDDLQ